MNVIYLRTFFVSYVLFIALCVSVIAPLWWYNRKRSPEIALWLIDYIFQFMGLLLITLRAIIPDFFSILVADILLIGGTIILYIGLGRYVNRRVRQFHNYVMLAVFAAVQGYFTYGYPDEAWRTINLSVALLYISVQASWLMLRGVDQSLRSATRMTGVVCVVFCLISVAQIVVNCFVPETHTIIVSNFFGIIAAVIYQMAFVALTFALFLMVSRRLAMELETKRLQREQEERMIRLRLTLLEFAMTHSLDEVLQKTLDEVENLLESPISFYHFVEEDQKTLSLQAWSARTLNEFCKTEGKGLHYAIDQAGVWTDCVYQKRAVIHNDYISLPHRKGLPEGHAVIVRELVVPIMRGGQVMAILGVGNKPSDYNEEDIKTVSLLADVAWEITLRKKAEEELRESEARTVAITDSAHDAIIMMDHHGNISYWNPAAKRILGYTADEVMGKNLHQLIVPERFMPDHLAAFPAFQKTGKGNAIGKTLELSARRKDGREIDINLSLSAVKIEGSWHSVGIVQDISERKRAEEHIRHLATHDPLTDLPSLRLAMDRLASALSIAHRYKRIAAVMFVDLDGFKNVNDTLGHDAGDYTLQEVARRLLSCVRETDTVARIGGDEFLIIATEINSPDNAAQIAEKIIQAVSQPVMIHGRQALIGASIGIALFPDHSDDKDQLIKLADEAMYKVKNSGKNGYRFVNT